MLNDLFALFLNVNFQRSRKLEGVSKDSKALMTLKNGAYIVAPVSVLSL